MEVASGLLINPRSSWADQAPTGPLEAEAAADVRFLLVHHTASSNFYSPEQVAGYLRGVFHFHTGPERGWPDIAYNFVVDRFGGIWEAREGSIDAPIKGSATGGSQGFALLCSFIGDHNLESPTPEALASMGTLLGWLAAKYAIDVSEGQTAEFTSRGSNRWPAGEPVVARTISGHREMSQTTCPGEYGYAAIDSDIGPRARLVASELLLDSEDEAVPSTTSTTEAPTTTTSTSTTVAPAPSVTAAPSDSGAGEATPVIVEDSPPSSWLLVPVAAVGAVAGAIALRRRRI